MELYVARETITDNENIVISPYGVSSIHLCRLWTNTRKTVGAYQVFSVVARACTCITTGVYFGEVMYSHLLASFHFEKTQNVRVVNIKLIR